MVTFKKPGWDLQEHCDSASPLLVRLRTWREAGAGTTSPASPRTAPGWSRCARWCWPAPGCPWATWGQCLLSLRHRLRELWAGFCFSRWAIQPYLSNLCINRRSTHIYICTYILNIIFDKFYLFWITSFVHLPLLARSVLQCAIQCFHKTHFIVTFFVDLKHCFKSKYCVNR